MTMQSIQLATVSGVVSMIEKVADAALKEGKQAPKEMMSAMDAVCNLLEARGKHDKQLLAVVAKVRQACNQKGKSNDSLV